MVHLLNLSAKNVVVGSVAAVSPLAQRKKQQ